MRGAASTVFGKFGSGLGCLDRFCGSAVAWPENRGTAEPANDNLKRFSGKLY
jgi:hypothetical protein